MNHKLATVSAIEARGLVRKIRWLDGEVTAAHDWDSVIAQPEAAIVGFASAVAAWATGSVGTAVGGSGHAA
jgi:hypothetical protein